MKNLSDPELFMLIQQDADEKAFAFLLDRYSRQLYDLIYRRTRSDDDAKDIMQDVFISLWTNRSGITVEKTLLPYLYRAAKNAIIDLAIKNQKVTAYQSLLSSQDEPFYYPAENTLIAAELKQQYEQELSKMPQTMQHVYRLSRDENKSAREIAGILQISEQTVRNNITMALQRLRLSFGADQMLVLLPFGLFCSSLILHK